MSGFTLPTFDQLGPDPEPLGARADHLLEPAAAPHRGSAASASRPARDSDHRVRVLVAGAGVGGLEIALALGIHGDLVRVDLLAPEACFTYRPLAVGEPFGGAATVQVDLGEIAAECGFGLIRDTLASVDASAKQVRTRAGTSLSYDVLVLALGARPQTAIPGALTFRGPMDVARLKEALEAVSQVSSPTIAFVAAGSATWSLPLYELALMTETWARKRSFTPEICIVTAEHSPLAAFGPEASEAVAGLLAQRGIRMRPDTYAASVAGDQLWIPIEGALAADLVVALPFLVGPLVDGLPGDELGFVPVDDFCRVEGLAGVYAIGDMTRQPVKQGGLAAQMADVAAACIAADAGAAVTPEPFAPVLRALLFTGERPLYLRNPPESETATPAGDDHLVAPWWPAHKIVSGHLAPYLATHADSLVPVSG